ncbi:MAG: hypothetical protein AB7G80_06195 [Dongiaceae bacterium]
MRLFLIALLALTVAACAAPGSSYETYSNRLDNYLGEHTDRLVEDWGPPDSLYQKADGTYMVTYKKLNLYDYPDLGIGRAMYNTRGDFIGYSAPMRYSDRVELRQCTTTFIANRRRIITDYSFYGDNCTAALAPPNQH